MALYIMNKQSGRYEKASNQTYTVPVQPRANLNRIVAAQKPEMDRLKKESDFANSKTGFLWNTLKAMPQATADMTFGNIARLIASAAKTPGDVARGSFDDKEIKIPGLSPFRTFQSQIGQTQQDVIEGNKSMGSLAWDVAQVPLAGMEALGAVKGVDKGIQAFKAASTVSQGIKSAVPEIVDAFVPTTRGMKKAKIQVAGQKQRGFITTMRGSQQTSSQTKKLLTDVNYTPQGNDELIKEASRQIKADIGAARTKALTGDDNQSVANAMELIKHYQNVGDHDQAAEIAKRVAEKLTEHGRAVQAASLYNKLTPEGIVRYAQKEAGKAGVTLNGKQTEELMNLALEANKAKGEDKAIKTFKMLDRVQEFIPSKLVDQAVTVWKAGLLSNPTTHLRNIVGNTSMTTLETVKDYPAVILDKIAALFTGQRTKALPSYKALGQGAVQGGKKALTFLKTGADVDQTLGKIDYKKVNLPPVLKQYTQTIFRALGAEDKVFKEALLKKSLHELAVVDGMNKGLKGGELARYAEHLFNNPTTQMLEQATNDALYGTFNSSNALATMLNRGKQHSSGAVRGATEFIAPFGRTPANIGARILDYAPTGFIKAGVHAAQGKGQRQIVEDLARAITGTGVMAGGYGLGKAGMMTGNYPTDPTQRALWDAQNLQPNSLKLGGKTYSMNSISPVGNLLGLGSGIQQLQGQVKPEQYPASVAALGGQTLVNQTFLQGVSGAMNALTDPGANASTYANNAASGIVPSILGAATKAVDPTMRQSNGMLDAIQAKIPFASRGLLPKVDLLGQERNYNDGSLGGRLNQFYNPFTPRETKRSPVIDELTRLDQSGSQVSASLPSKTMSMGKGLKVSLTPEEYTKLEKESGGAVGKMLALVFAAPEYQQLSDYDKANAVNTVIQKIRQLWGVQNIGNIKNAKEQILNQAEKQLKLKQPYYSK